jgi:hypothetical protein
MTVFDRNKARPYWHLDYQEVHLMGGKADGYVTGLRRSIDAIVIPEIDFEPLSGPISETDDISAITPKFISHVYRRVGNTHIFIPEAK